MTLRNDFNHSLLYGFLRDKVVAKEVDLQRNFSLEVKRCSRNCFFPR